MKIKTTGDPESTSNTSFITSVREVYGKIDAKEDCNFFLSPDYKQYFLDTYGNLPKIIFVWNPAVWYRKNIPLYENIKTQLPTCKIFLYMNDCHYMPDGRFSSVVEIVDKIVIVARQKNVSDLYNFTIPSHKLLFEGPGCSDCFHKPEINWQSENKIYFFGRQYENRRNVLEKITKLDKTMLTVKSHPVHSDNAAMDSTLSAQQLYNYSFSFTSPCHVKNPFTGGKTSYLVEKIFEIMGSGCLLLFDDTGVVDDMLEIGLKAGQHYVSLTPETVTKTINWLIKCRKQRRNLCNPSGWIFPGQRQSTVAQSCGRNE